MTETGRRIGFVDYDLANFHANTLLAKVRQDLKDRGFEVAAGHGLKARPSREWAQANNVPYFDDLAEMNERVDGYMVLAPSNPEVHLRLCERVFPFGKTTYVDKTFAPDLATARKIFALADRHRVKIQTASALRYTNVQEHVAAVGGPAKVRHMVAWGGGRRFCEYAIHPVELVVSCMGPRAESLMRRGAGQRGQLLVNFSGGRSAVINVYCRTKTPFAASVTTAEGTTHVPVDGSRIFTNLASAVLDLLATGRPNVPRAETLMIRRILDAAEDKRAMKGFIRL